VLTAGVMLAATAVALVISTAAPASAGSVPGTHVQGPGTCPKYVPPGAAYISLWTSYIAYDVKDVTIGRDGQGQPTDALSTANPSVAPLWLDITVPAPGPLGQDTVDLQADGAHHVPLEQRLPDSQMIVTSVPVHAHDFAWNTDGSFSWNPLPGYEGGDSFTYMVEDAQGYCYGPATVTIPPPRVDHLADDGYTVYNDRTTTSGSGGLEVCGTNLSPVDGQTYATCGLLKNDDASFVGGLVIPPDGHFPFAPDQPRRLAHGSVDVRRDGSWSYTPDPGYVGDETFYYMGYYDGRFHSIAGYDGALIAGFDHSFPYAGVAQVTFHVENPPAPSYVQNSPVSLSVDENTTGPSTFTPLSFDPQAVLTAAQPDASPVIGVDGVLGDVQGLGTNPPTSVRTAHGTLGLTWGSGFVDASGNLVPCSDPACAFQKIYISNLTYTPDPEYFGADEFDYSTLGMYFPKGVPSTQWPDFNVFTPVRVPVHITVNEVPTMPGLIPTTFTVPNHHGVTFQLADALDDPDGVAHIDAATYQQFDLTPTGGLGGSSGTLVDNGGGSYTFTATSAGAPSDLAVFLFSIPTTLGSQIAQPEVTFTVAPDAAVDDSYRTDENQTLTVSAAGGVLANDAPPGVASLQTQAQDGTVSLDADGSFTYVPDQNFSGTDTFTYLDDGAAGTVTVAVDHVLQPPAVTLNSSGCDPLLVCPFADPDNRFNLAAGADGRLRGFVSDPEFSHGTMTIDWGDGTTTTAVYPPSALACLPGSGCPFSSRPTYGFPCGVSPCPGTPLYFEFDHQYGPVPAGPPTTYTITATANADDGLSGHSTSTATVYQPPAQAIDFTPPASGVAGTDLALSATGGGSGNPVIFSVDPSTASGVCSVSGAQLTLIAPGSCVVDANQAGDGTYGAAPQVSKTITVLAPDVITGFSLPASGLVGDPPITLSATGGGSSSPVVFSVDPATTAGVCSLSGTALSLTGAGSCTVDANQAGDGTHGDAAAVFATIGVSQRPATITRFILPLKGHVGDAVPLSARGSGSSTPVVFSVDPSTAAGVCSVSGNTLSLTAGGTCVVDADQPGDTEYLDAPTVQRTMTVLTPQSITFTPPASAVIRGRQRLTASATSGRTVQFAVDTTSGAGTCSISHGVVSFTGVGSCIVDARQPGDATWAAAPPVQRSITVMYGFGGYLNPVPGGAVKSTASTIPVRFTLTNAAGRQISSSVAAALAAAGMVQVTLAGPGIEPVTTSCRSDAVAHVFLCNINTPPAVRTGRLNPYTISATEKIGDAVVVAIPIGGAVNPATIYFK
jgi:hypothetical protein